MSVFLSVCFIPVLEWISFLSEVFLVLLYPLDPFVSVGPPQGLSFSDTSIILKPFTFWLTPVVVVKSNHTIIGFFWKLFQYFFWHLKGLKEKKVAKV